MSIIETYLFLLTDSFISGLFLPTGQALVFPAMRGFGGYNQYFVSFLYTIGITSAAILNWFFGKLLRSLKKDMPLDESNKRMERIFIFLKKYGCLYVLIICIPALCPILTLIGGVIQTSFRKTITIVFIVNMLNSFYYILH